MTKLKMWQGFENSAKAWDERANIAAKSHPLKDLKQMPLMPGITEDTAKNLKWKSLKWMVLQDKDWYIFKKILKHPITYGKAFIKSVFKKKSYVRDGDFFYYGIKNESEFAELIKDTSNLLVLGFSYCHKPFECPSGRFTPDCINDQNNSVCQQCFIGKTGMLTPQENVITLHIPTIHYIGGKILEIAHDNPTKKIIFMITACEMTLEMFGDWGNMVGIQGIGIRLAGRICNTMKAFELSERGIKPGLTVVLDETKERLLNLLGKRIRI